MEKTNKEILNAVERLLHGIHMGQRRKILNLCKNNILWKYNHSCSKGIMDEKTIISLNKIIAPSEIKRLEQVHHYIHRLSPNHTIITGIYCIHKAVDKNIKKHYFDYTIIFSDGLACYIQIFGINLPSKIHRVVSITESVYIMQESEILYVEAMGGHTIWHCMNTTIESTVSLKNAVIRLSDNFVRVHRGYTVNKKMIASIQRCSVSMINGDVIPIPYKKYVNVRRLLLAE